MSCGRVDQRCQGLFELVCDQGRCCWLLLERACADANLGVIEKGRARTCCQVQPVKKRAGRGGSSVQVWLHSMGFFIVMSLFTFFFYCICPSRMQPHALYPCTLGLSRYTRIATATRSYLGCAVQRSAHHGMMRNGRWLLPH